MKRAVIIEDEVRSRKMLENSLRNYCPQIEVAGFAETVLEGVKVISERQPDLLFMDIDLPDGSGFDILQQLPRPWPGIIFVTAYNEYAIHALRISAVDYLLKPVDPEQLKLAVAKAVSGDESAEMQEQKVQTFTENQHAGRLNKMVLPTGTGLRFVHIKDIVRLQAEGNYTTFFLAGKSSIIVSRPIKEYEATLESAGFFRVHQSHIINLNLIDRYLKGEGGTVVMEDGTEIEVARRRKEAFLLRLME